VYDPWLVLSVIVIPAIMILVGILIVLKIFKDRKSGFPVADERTRKINGKAASYALIIGSYFMIAFISVLIIGQEFLDLPAIEAGYALIASVLALDLSFLGLRWYFGRKGDFY